MWQFFRDVLMSPNAGIVLTFGVFIVVIGWVLTKTGLLNIQTEKVTLGAATTEREIIRQQVEWTKLHFDGMEARLEKRDDTDQWRRKYIAECLYDEYVNWITFNHLNTSSAYIEVKQDKIVSLFRSLPVDKEYRTHEFEQYLRDDTRKSIEKLIRIREVYRNK